ncbi:MULTISPECIES: hypothetical protein [unclassified Mesorhizobium]|uniref:hypothetical protein n=1 Tax=unclassified Mesorhizobium TaxID=325217 RepID=UPI00333675BB
MELRIDIRGAKPEEIVRGLNAAQLVFDRQGIAAEVAASGVFALQVWDIKGSRQGEEPSESQKVAADVWLKAERAAYEACCTGWLEQPAISRWALCLGPTEPKVKTAYPATWPERQQLYPKLIERLEAATCPDRQLDIDICYVMGWVNERGMPEEAAELGLPYLTGNLAEVASITQKSLQDWTIEVGQAPCDARIIAPERDEHDNRSVAAWRSFDGRLNIEKSPANTAIALTLAAMRLQADSFFEPAW